MVQQLSGGFVGRMLTRHAVGERLGLDVRTVDRMIRAGQLQAVKLGRNVRVPEDEVNRIAANGIARIGNGGGK